MSITKIKRLTGLLFFAAGIVLISFIATNATAATLTVDDDGNAEYTKIQDAIDNATEGDTIRVYEGIYNENVVVNKTVSLIGNGSEETTIDVERNGDVVIVEADWVNMSGFTVTGSSLSTDPKTYGGINIISDFNTVFNNNCTNNLIGVVLRDSHGNTINRNDCSNNSGNGIYLYPHSTHNILANNTCLKNAYLGIFLVGSSHNSVSNNTCNENTYVGIQVDPGADNNTITSNTCTDNGDVGIGLDGSDENSITMNLCTRNRLDGIYFEKSTNNTITSNTCIDNRRNGIGLEDNSHDNTMTHNTCSNNKKGIFLSSSSACIMTNNTISGNGEGIHLKSSQSNSAHHNDIFNNTEYGINATENGGFQINATKNYWGHLSGPYHPGNNTQGKGDEITDDILFEPWLDEKGNVHYSSPEEGDDDGGDDGFIPGFGVVALIVGIGVSIMKFRRRGI